MEARHEQSKEQQLVVFIVGEDEFGIAINVVREIINETKVVRLPETPEFVMGVINLRGRVIPVIDLAERLGMSLVQHTEETRKILIVELGDQHVGYLVSGVTEVLNVPADALESPDSALGGLDNSMVDCMCKFNDRLFPVLNTELFSCKEMDAVANLVTS